MTNTKIIYSFYKNNFEPAKLQITIVVYTFLERKRR